MFHSIKSLRIVLQDIDDLESEQGLDNQQKDDGKKINRGCWDALKELEATLDEY